MKLLISKKSHPQIVFVVLVTLTFYQCVSTKCSYTSIVQIRISEGSGFKRCTGTIVDLGAVVTVSSCVYNSARSDIKIVTNTKPEKIMEVRRVLHFDNSPPEKGYYKNDLALLQLAKRLRSTNPMIYDLKKDMIGDILVTRPDPNWYSSSSIIYFKDSITRNCTGDENVVLCAKQNSANLDHKSPECLGAPIFIKQKIAGFLIRNTTRSHATEPVIQFTKLNFKDYGKWISETARQKPRHRQIISRIYNSSGPYVMGSIRSKITRTHHIL